MLKQKNRHSRTLCSEKNRSSSSARTLLILDGQENAYISADELTEEL